jgi:hypothetical protein
MSINIHAQDKVMGIRDKNGACRYLEFGNLPIPEDIKDFHRQKVAERETAEGRTLDYYAVIDDFWAISKGRWVFPAYVHDAGDTKKVDVVVAGSGVTGRCSDPMRGRGKVALSRNSGRSGAPPTSSTAPSPWRASCSASGTSTTAATTRSRTSWSTATGGPTPGWCEP